ncbi:MAG: alpha/beta hydrolase fold domain-containing protein [Pseudomonadales bacterium]|jgi:acetyl esterase/lipase
MSNPNLPGKLGDPNRTLFNDERADPRIVAALQAMGTLGEGVPPVDFGAPLEECLAYCDAFERVAAQAHPLMFAAMPEYPTVVSTTEIIKGIDGNDITLHIHKPIGAKAPAPCIFHTHGGGMAIMTAADPNFIRWRNDLAAAGLVVVGVEFRNAAGSLGAHPFPAGLNDCASALQWTHANKANLNINKIILSGESGGGNLALANALKAKQEGWLDHIDGIYAMCPYISGCYDNPPENLLSLKENDGYTLNGQVMSALVTAYDPDKQHTRNPLAWPYHATPESLAGMPPCIISVNELDPLRDEGLAFARKLKLADVSVVAKTVNGTHHAGDLAMPDITPDIYQETLRSLVGFARSL